MKNQRKTYTVGTDSWIESYINEVKPFAFGLKAIMIAIVGVDRDGFATEVEEGLNSLEEIQTVILEEQSLI